MKVIHWNCRSAAQRIGELAVLEREIDPDIVCLSETKFGDLCNFSMLNYSIICCNRNSRGGGTAILIKKNIRFQHVIPECHAKAKDNNVDVVCCLILLRDDRRLKIVSIYSPPRRSGSFTEASFWNSIFHSFLDDSDLLICGDLNGHHTLWSSHPDLIPDIEGKKIERASDSAHLVCLNTGEDTWRSEDLSMGSAIDVAFVSRSIAPNADWTLLDSTFGSDHFPAIISLDEVSSAKIPCRPSFATGRVDWSLFQEKFTQYYQGRNANSDYDIYSYDDFISCIYSALGDAGGRRRDNKKFFARTPTIWWDDECSTLIAEKRASFSTFKRAPSISNYNNYKKTSAVTKKRLLQIKKQKFRDFCASLNPDMDIANIWFHIRAFKRKCGNAPHTSTASVRLMGAAVGAFDKAVPRGLPNDDIPPPPTAEPSPLVPSLPADVRFPINKVTDKDSIDMLLRPFTVSEFSLAFNSLKRKAASGPDMISNKILSHLPECGRSTLLKIFNCIFNYGKFPIDWKKYFMCFIPKSGGNYELRPISLACNIAKLFEKIIQYRLEWFVERHDILPNFQFGFRKGRSCKDNLVTLTSDIHEAFANREWLGAVFVDIKGAFDNVNINKLLYILNEMGLPSKIIKFIRHMTTDRIIEGFYDGESLGIRVASKGVPQGSVLSPLLFNIYVAYICHHIPGGVTPLMYADDLVLYYKSSELPDVFHTLNDALSVVSENLREIDLTISAPKTQLCIFTTVKFVYFMRLVREQNLTLSLDGQIIPPSPFVKFLGVTFDSCLKWRKYVDILKISIGRRINVLRAIAGITWGAHPCTLLMAYKALIRASFDWGAQVMNGLDPSLDKILTSLQCSALRVVMGLMNTTPRNVVIHISGEMCLPDRRKFLTSKYFAKIISNSRHPLTARWSAYLRDGQNLESYSASFLHTEICRLLSEYGGRLMDSPMVGSLSYTYETRFFEPAIDCSFGLPLVEFKSGHPSDRGLPPANPNFEDGPLLRLSCDVLSDSDKVFATLIQQKGPCKFIYTDGSKQSDGSAGFALFVADSCVFMTFSVNSLLTIFEIEALAILYAVNYIGEGEIGTFAIASDSLSGLSALAHPDRKGDAHPIIYQIKQRLRELCVRGFNVSLIWIPGHAGICGNDIADFLAGCAAESARGRTSEELDFRFCYPTDLTPGFRDQCLASSYSSMIADAEFTGYRYFNKVKEKCGYVWFRRYKELGRQTISLVCRLRSFHVRTNQHLFDKNIIAEPACPCGCPSQDIEHVFFHCPLHTEESSKLIIDLHKLGYGPPMEDLIFEEDPRIFNILTQFIKNCKLDI